MKIYYYQLLETSWTISYKEDLSYILNNCKDHKHPKFYLSQSTGMYIDYYSKGNNRLPVGAYVEGSWYKNKHNMGIFNIGSIYDLRFV